jgi:indolepyruvate ferredoxin oxidoreductase
VLDVTGLARKNGPVTSHVRVARDAGSLSATRIGAGGADLVIGCDIVVTTNAENLAKLAPKRTTPIVNSHVAPTSDFATNPDLDLSSRRMEDAIRAATGEEAATFVAATRLATALCGDAIFTNPFLMGFAYQRGRLPVGRPALERAFALNGRAVEANLRAFAWGRLAAHDLAAVEQAAGTGPLAAEREADETLDALLARHTAFLTDYHDAAYARRYRAFVERVAAREQEVAPGSDALARAVARYYAKLLAIKDEFEVARLYTDGIFQRQLDAEFEGDYRLYVHFAPPFSIPIVDRLTGRRDPDTGRMKKWRLAAWWFLPFLRLLARAKILRFTPLNFPARTAHRRLERRLIADYESMVETLLAGLQADNLEIAVECASLPEHVRGFEQVREESLEAVEAKRDELVEAFRLRTG